MKKGLFVCLVSFFASCDLSQDPPPFGVHPIRIWAHKLDGCVVSVSLDDSSNVRSEQKCGESITKATARRLVDEAALKTFRRQWFESVEVFRSDVRKNNCAGNEHSFFTDNDAVSTGLYQVCGAGGELLDARGLPSDLQTLIISMLNASGL